MVLRPNMSPADVQKTTLAVGVAVAKAIVQSTGLRPELKWPNDVLVDNKKVCGILTEASVKSGTVEFLVVGIGINANVDPSTLPPDLCATTTSLSNELKRDVPLDGLTAALLQELQQVYKSLRSGQFASILNDWRRLANTLQSWVEVRTPNQTIHGFAEDIDHDGALILRLTGGSHARILAGDASLRRKDAQN